MSRVCRNFEQMKRLSRSLVIGIFLLMLCIPHKGKAQLQWAYTQQKVDSVLELQYFSTRMPGYAMCIIKDGQVVYSGVRGKASVREDIKISLSTEFNIGSVTKQFTAAAIYLLEEQGLLSVNDPVTKYIPEFPQYPTPVTVEQLIHHTSGVRDHLEVAILLSRYKEKYSSLDGMLDWVVKYPELNTPPGTYFAYSNTNYMLLAVIIERISGMSYAEFLQKNIFDPLGMKNSYVEEGKHKTLRDGTTHYEINYKETKAKPADAVYNALGATGVISSIEDMVKWDNNFYKNKLGKGSQDLITKMTTSGKLNDGTLVNYGGGILLKTYRHATVQEHSGGWGEYLTQYRRFPEERVTVLICVNSYLTSPFDMADNVSDVIFNYKNIHTLTQNTLSEKVRNEICGPYAAENNLIRYMYVEKDTLKIARISEGDTTAYPLQYVGATAEKGLGFLDTTGAPLVIKYAGSDPHELIWAEGTYFATDRSYIKVDTLTPPNYYKYHGKYYCEEFGKRIRIQYFSKQDELSIHPFPFVKYNLTPKGGDWFQVEGQPYMIHFSTGSLVFGNDWVFNIRFEKKVKKKIDLWPFNNGKL